MEKYRIPFNKPTIVGNEIDYIKKAFKNGHISGDGDFTKKCSEWLEVNLNVAKALLTPSGTHALEMSAFLLDISPGDEVVVPSFTFVSTINAFVVRGARPIFIDIRPDTLNMDETQLEDKITPRTKAILPVHYAGVACEMDEILTIASHYEIPVVEDNAHGLFGQYKGKPLGSFGCMAAQSFHETKNITCGEGGALLINTPEYVERAEIVREKGTNRSRFFRGQVDKYTWVDKGSSYLPSDISAAVLYAQLQSYRTIQKIRSRIWNNYKESLESWAIKNDVSLPEIPSHCDQPHHIFYMLMPSLDARRRMIQHLKEKSILSVFHYIPLHVSEMGRKFGGKKGDFPVTENTSDCLLRLPLYSSLEESEQTYVIKTIKELTF